MGKTASGTEKTPLSRRSRAQSTRTQANNNGTNKKTWTKHKLNQYTKQTTKEPRKDKVHTKIKEKPQPNHKPEVNPLRNTTLRNNDKREKQIGNDTQKGRANTGPSENKESSIINKDHRQ